MEAHNELSGRVQELENRVGALESRLRQEVTGTGAVGKQEPRPVDVNTGQARVESGEAPTPEGTGAAPVDPTSVPAAMQGAPDSPSSMSPSSAGEPAAQSELPVQAVPDPASPQEDQPTPGPGVTPQG